MPRKTKRQERSWQPRVHGIDGTGLLVDAHSAHLKVLEGVEEINYQNSGLGVGYNRCYHIRKRWQHEYRPIRQLQGGGITDSDLTFDPATVFIQNGMNNDTFTHRLMSLAENAVNDSNLNHMAVRAMWPKIPRFISIANFLWELKDYLKLFVLWNPKITPLRNASAAFLNGEFGWRPFMKDLVDILNTFNKLKKRLKAFASGVHVPHVSHYSMDLAQRKLVPKFMEIDLPDQFTNFHYEPNNSDSLVEGGFQYSTLLTANWLVTPKWTATMKYSYHCPELLDKMRDLRALLDAFNVYWDPQVIWNAIPFSFVVDWFVNAGDWLHASFAKPRFDFNVRIIDFCISVKADAYTAGMISIPENASQPEEKSSNFAYRDLERLYYRAPQVPILKDPLHKREPLKDIERFLIALALGHNCSRPRKRSAHHNGKGFPRNAQRGVPTYSANYRQIYRRYWKNVTKK